MGKLFGIAPLMSSCRTNIPPRTLNINGSSFISFSINPVQGMFLKKRSLVLALKSIITAADGVIMSEG
ncbi:hypothetical protein HS7_06410 [Sulfolobales archaeon HS-7]|nr:hypothetical protein HS7_06410 [Sulfolobales archaeon HS-7]